MPAGRPPVVSDEMYVLLFRDMAEGLNLLEACRKHGVAYGTVTDRIYRDSELSVMCARAKELYAHAMVDHMTLIAQNEEDVQRARLMCDNVKWIAAKTLPKAYGKQPDTGTPLTELLEAVLTEPSECDV